MRNVTQIDMWLGSALNLTRVVEARISGVAPYTVQAEDLDIIIRQAKQIVSDLRAAQRACE